MDITIKVIILGCLLIGILLVCAIVIWFHEQNMQSYIHALEHQNEDLRKSLADSQTISRSKLIDEFIKVDPVSQYKAGYLFSKWRESEASRSSLEKDLDEVLNYVSDLKGQLWSLQDAFRSLRIDRYTLRYRIVKRMPSYCMHLFLNVHPNKTTAKIENQMHSIEMGYFKRMNHIAQEVSNED